MNIWYPNALELQKTNIFQAMKKLGFENYKDFWQWSVDRRESFWEFVINTLEIPFFKKPNQILDLTYGVTQPRWLNEAKLNIVEACFTQSPDATAVIFQKEGGDIQFWTYQKLEKLVNQIANSFQKIGLQKGDVIAIDMSMNVEAIAIYLAGIKAGLTVVTIADSFTSQEIAVRIELTKPLLVFTQSYLIRNEKQLPLYQKVVEANSPKIVLLNTLDSSITLRKNDVFWADFLSENDIFFSVPCAPDDIITVLFSSGTTAVPKAIPWTHITPIKSASDGYFHQDIQPGDVVAWPTNLGWMMGPWLVFATFINKGTMAVFEGSPIGKEFGKFVEESKVSMLGVVPGIVKHWKNTGCMETYHWNSIKCFSSTGEASHPDDYTYLMKLAGNKPIIEYCGGTEIGGGYLSSTLVQDNIPSTFSTKALGSDFVILDENHEKNSIGEVFLIPPTLGLSNSLLNKNHYEVYYQDIDPYKGQTLRRHGDQIEELSTGYFKAQGRVDDAMNLGGIKVSSLEIETCVNSLEFILESAAISVAPKGGGPENLIIYFVPQYKIDYSTALSELSQKIKNEINPLFKVKDVVSIDALPRTSSGKVMRRTLRKWYVER